MSKKKTNPYRGTSLDEFLEEEGILEEATAKAAKKALAWQFARAIEEQNVTKAALARRMNTSRAQLDPRPREPVGDVEDAGAGS